MSSRICAVIADAGHPVALGVIHALGRRGVPVVGLFSRPTGSESIFSRSIAASRYLTRSVVTEGGLVDALAELGRTLPQRAVLIPTNDESMLAISTERARLEPYFLLRMPGQALIQSLLEKDRFVGLAEQHQLPVPQSFAVSDETSLHRAGSIIPLPCVIKPPWRDERWIEAHGAEKLFVAKTKEEFETVGRQTLDFCGRFVAQRLVAGPESNIVCSFAFLDDHSQPVEIALCRKIRQYPPNFGNTAMAESISNGGVEQLTIDVCRTLGLVGYVSIEFKREEATGQWLILEITPSRVNRQIACSDLAGRSIVHAWYCSLSGGSSAEKRPLHTGVRWVSLGNELRSFRYYLRDGGWSLPRWLRSFARVRGIEMFSLRDPLPFLKFVAVAALRFVVGRNDAT